MDDAAPVKRRLKFLHWFSGPCKFGLGEAVAEEAKKIGWEIEVVNRDLLADGSNLLEEEPFRSDLAAAEAGEIHGFHSGFRCSSFSRVRFRPGGPPPLRTRQHLYGMPDNSCEQQAEAEAGNTWPRGQFSDAKLWRKVL